MRNSGKKFSSLEKFLIHLAVPFNLTSIKLLD